MDQQAGTIVIPLDMSVVSEQILLPAAGLAQALQYDLTLLHVVPPASSFVAIGNPALLNPGLAERWEADALAGAHVYLAEVAQRVERLGLSVRTNVRIGPDTAAAILDCVRDDLDLLDAMPDQHQTMIAMTTHGRSGFRHWTLGSVAEQVIHRATVPLLLLRTDKASGPFTISDAIRTILVPLDDSAFAAQALPYAQRIATATRASVILLAVMPQVDDIGLADGGIEPLWLVAQNDSASHDAYAMLESAALHMRPTGIDVQTRIVTGDPATEIVHASVTNNAQLIVMATHGRSGVQRLMLGSVAQKVLHSAAQPLLLVRPTRLAAERQVVGSRAKDNPTTPITRSAPEPQAESDASARHAGAGTR